MTLIIIATYAIGWVVTAIAYAYFNSGAAPSGPDPVGVGLLLGAIWPIFWPIVALAGLVEAGVHALRKIRP